MLNTNNPEHLLWRHGMDKHPIKLADERWSYPNNWSNKLTTTESHTRTTDQTNRWLLNLIPKLSIKQADDHRISYPIKQANDCWIAFPNYQSNSQMTTESLTQTTDQTSSWLLNLLPKSQGLHDISPSPRFPTFEGVLSSFWSNTNHLTK